METSRASRGRFYWLLRNGTRSFLSRVKRRPLTAMILVASLLLVAFASRAYVQPFVLELRKLSFLIALFVPLLGLVWVLTRRFSGKLRVLTLFACVALVVVARQWELRAFEYVRLYHRYATLSVEELTELPLTDHERIHPLNSVYSLAHEMMTETEAPQRPDFVRVGDGYRWSMAIEPAYPMRRAFGGVAELFSIPGTAPAPSFSEGNRVEVRFDVGENLLFSHSSRVATIRTFGPWRYLTYEPADVVYVIDDEGRWVQLVSLIRWRGLLFPRPEFGGVQLIRQAQPGLRRSARRVMIGAGEWIRPQDVASHRFLVGQNVVPVQVSRFIANSFRFQNGFWAPFPGYHRGDIRIPDLPTDVNDQPFTAYFRLPTAEGAAKLYHYFALEPFDPDKQGLNTSLLVPADGLGPVRAYRHREQRGTLAGVSAIAAKVMESRKNYDWSRNRPVEHRPFIKHIDGEPRFFWLTTVVTVKEVEGDEEGGRFIAGNVPDVVLTDAAFNTPVWVDPLARDTWEGQLAAELGALWSRR